MSVRMKQVYIQKKLKIPKKMRFFQDFTAFFTRLGKVEIPKIKFSFFNKFYQEF